MEGLFEAMTYTDVVGVIGAGFDSLADDQRSMPGGRELLGLIRQSQRIVAQAVAWQQALVARAEDAELVWQEYGTSTATWLADVGNLTRREAGRLIGAGQDVSRFPVIAEAAAAGRVLPQQSRAITRVLAALPEDFPAEVVRQGEDLMVEFAARHNSAELSRLTGRLLEVLAPEVAESLDAARLAREEQVAQRTRHLAFSSDGHGSVRFRGSLPTAQAEPFIRLVDAYAAAESRGAEQGDPAAVNSTPGMRRADGLVSLVDDHCRQGLAPADGGDRPRIVVTLAHHKLVKAATDNGLITGELTGTGESLSDGCLRRLLCDADVLPVVLGGRSEVLDVGRTRRLVTGPIRAALEIRDGGCAFPGCAKPPRACHAHHLKPWWAGGSTSLANLVLVCPHHHGIVEPGRDPTADRWSVRLAADGTPEVVPPRYVDPGQRPRRNARFWNHPA